MVISGGDMADDGELSEELMDFIDKIKSSAMVILYYTYCHCEESGIRSRRNRPEPGEQRGIILQKDPQLFQSLLDAIINRFG